MTPTEAALGYLKKGWRSVPIPRVCPTCRHQHAGLNCTWRDRDLPPCTCKDKYERSQGAVTKGPTASGWNHRFLSEAAILTAFYPSDSIGLLLGEPSGWLVDVDLDCPEAVALAPDFLPKTALESGRTGKPRSHYWYVCLGASTRKFQYRPENKSDPATILEIRSTGGQTVVPPSLYEYGGEYMWHEKGEPLLVDKDSLVLACAKLTLASLLTRYWPGPGARHDAALPIAGLLAHAGWKEEDAARIIFLSSCAAGHAKPNDRENVAHTTYRRYENKQDTQGGGKLKDYFPPGAATRIIELAYEISGKKRDLLIAPRETPAEEPWKPALFTFSQLTEKKVPYLWYPYLPLGRVTILEGDPGQGKSWFALAVATCVSLGQWLEIIPGEESYETPSGVIYLTCEDDPEDTIKKRLRILQADQSRIHYLDGKKKENQTSTLAITMADISILQEAVQQTQAKLLIIDPVQAYLPDRMDMNKMEQITALMKTLQRFAMENQLSILLVRHLAKGTKERSAYKGMGSMAFYTSARSVLVCAERTELAEQRDGLFTRRFAVAHPKNNVGQKGPAIEFELQKDSFVWRGTADLTADDLLTSLPADGVSPSAIQEAKTFLISTLRSGPLPIGEIRKHARKVGVPELALTVAKTELQVASTDEGSGWIWTLPGKYMAH